MVRGGCGLKQGAQEEMRGIGSAAQGPPGSFAGAHVIRLLCFFCTAQGAARGSDGWKCRMEVLLPKYVPAP